MKAPWQQAAVGSVVAQTTFAALSRDDLRRYAEASGDQNPLHLDPEFARRAGFGEVIVHGMLVMALLGRLIEEAFPDARLMRFRTRFRSVIPVGKPIVCVARLEGSHGDVLDIALTAFTDGAAPSVEGMASMSLPGSG